MSTFRNRCLTLIALATTALAGPVAWAQAPTRSVTQGLSQARVRAEAARIDTLLDAGLRKAGVEPAPELDDQAFARRAHLTIVGRNPTLAELDAFLADSDPARRDRLVDRLLDSPGRTAHETNGWADLLRARTRLMRQVSGEPFLAWIRGAIAADMPYDEFVRAMLTAEGAAHKEGNGATGFLLRDLGMPHDAMANTLRLFLGTRLECAQCHNHPSDKWTQKQFFEMAAFFGGIQYRSPEETAKAAATVRALARDGSRAEQQVARQLLQNIDAGIRGTGTGVEKLPDDYKYGDAKPKEPVFANTIFGADVKLPRPNQQAQPAPRTRARPAQQRTAAPAAQVESRRHFADWLTARDNPRFAQVIANRMWQRTFGRGLIEPVDDIRDGTKAVHPELMDHLASLVRQLDYDLRQFQRVLLHTKLSRRAAVDADAGSIAPFLFEGPVLQRLSAEQMWDSMLALVLDDLDERLRPADARAREVYDRFEELATADEAALRTTLERSALRVSDPQAFRAQQAERAREEAAKRLAEQKDLEAKVAPLFREYLAARRSGDLVAAQKLADEIQKLGFTIPGERLQRATGASDTSLARAVDLPQPAPASHLLRQFGQSDRETVDSATREGSVPQVLTLMNGFVDQRIMAAGSALRRDLEAADTPAAKVEVAFLTILGRKPNEAEQEAWRPVVVLEKDAGLRDLVWVLCNSSEFKFVP